MPWLNITLMAILIQTIRMKQLKLPCIEFESIFWQFRLLRGRQPVQPGKEFLKFRDEIAAISGVRSG